MPEIFNDEVVTWSHGFKDIQYLLYCFIRLQEVGDIYMETKEWILCKANNQYEILCGFQSSKGNSYISESYHTTYYFIKAENDMYLANVMSYTPSSTIVWM